MRIVRLILACGLLALPSTLPAASGPALAKLEYGPGILFADRASIYAVNAIQTSPYAGKPKAVWVLRAGDAIRTATPPPERFIRFYRINGKEAETICTVIVKYVAENGVWRPSYQMLQQPMVVHDGNKLVPVTTTDSARGLVQLFELQSPSRDGFYRELVFGYASEKTTIDAWEVQ